MSATTTVPAPVRPNKAAARGPGGGLVVGRGRVWARWCTGRGGA